MGRTTTFGKKALLSGVSGFAFFVSEGYAQDNSAVNQLFHDYEIAGHPKTTNVDDDYNVEIIKKGNEKDYIHIDIPEKKGRIDVIFPFASLHEAEAPEGDSFTEFNPGIGLAYTRDLRGSFTGSWTTSAAVFEDSYGVFSGIVRTNYSEEVPGVDWLHVGATLALAYKATDFSRSRKFIAAPLLHVKVDITDRISISAEGIPFNVGDDKKAFLGFEGSYKIGKMPPE